MIDFLVRGARMIFTNMVRAIMASPAEPPNTKEKKINRLYKGLNKIVFQAVFSIHPLYRSSQKKAKMYFRALGPLNVSSRVGSEEFLQQRACHLSRDRIFLSIL